MKKVNRSGRMMHEVSDSNKLSFFVDVDEEGYLRHESSSDGSLSGSDASEVLIITYSPHIPNSCFPSVTLQPRLVP